MARISLDPPRSLIYRLTEWYSRRQWGTVADPAAAMGHNPRVLLADARFEMAVDKYLAMACLEADGLPVPPTWSGESADGALAAFEEFGRDVVVKPLFGSEGRGLVRVSDRELARRAFQTLARLGAVLYVQRTVRHPGHDLRAFVLRPWLDIEPYAQLPGHGWVTDLMRTPAVAADLPGLTPRPDLVLEPYA